MKKRISLFVFALALPALVFAHHGWREIKGTIAKISSDSIVVTRTDKANETVVLTKSTAYKAGSAAATVADMHIGERVVVHFGPDGKSAVEVHLPAKR